MILGKVNPKLMEVHGSLARTEILWISPPKP
jgi:hypothetical protein